MSDLIEREAAVNDLSETRDWFLSCLSQGTCFESPGEAITAFSNEAIKNLRALPAATDERCKAERDWLRRRAAMAGHCSLTDDRDCGISSNAMVEYALGGPLPSARQYPLDSSDMWACRLCRDNAPEHLYGRMDEVLALYEERMAARRQLP